MNRPMRFITSMLLLGGAAVRGAEPTLDEIYQVWEARAGSIRTAEIRWTETSIYPKGSQFRLDVRAEGPLPTQDTEVEREWVVYLDENQWRKEFTGPIWDTNEGRFIDSREVDTFDGSDFFAYAGIEAEGNIAHPTGHIWPDEEGNRPDLPLLDLPNWPVFNTYRAIDPRQGEFRNHEWFVLPQKMTIHGRETIVIEQVRPGSSGFLRCYLDPSRGYGIVRRELGRHGGARGPVIEIDVDYREDSVAGIVPIGWTITFSRIGRDGMSRLDHQSEAVVTAAIFNAPIDREKIFTFEFPPGTEVYDHRQKPESRYIVKAEDQARPVLDSELKRGATYSDLIRTAPGEAALPEQSTAAARTVWLAVAGVFVLALAGWLFWRRRAE